MWTWKSCRIAERRIDDVAILDIKGNITRDRAAETLCNHVAVLVAAGERNILLNLKHVHRINHLGMGALLAAYICLANRSGNLKLVSVRDRILWSLDSAMLTPFFDLHQTQEEALASFAALAERQRLAASASPTVPIRVVHPHRPAPAKIVCQRKGDRVPLTLLLRAQWRTSNGVPSWEETMTEVINNAGARIRLKTHVDPGQELEIDNLYNMESARAKVVWVSQQENHAGYGVGIKFLSPQATKWCREFSA